MMIPPADTETYLLAFTQLILQDVPWVSMIAFSGIPVVIVIVLVWKTHYASRSMRRRLPNFMQKWGFLPQRDSWSGTYKDLAMGVKIVGTKPVDPFGWVQTLVVDVPNPVRRPLTRRQLLPLIGPDLRAEEGRLAMDWRIGGEGLQIGASSDSLEILFQIPFSLRDLYLRRDRARLLRTLGFLAETQRMLRRFTPVPSTQPEIQPKALPVNKDFVPGR